MLIGAGIGALTGAAVGNYMDKQEAQLRAQLQGTGVSVTRIGDSVILNMPGNITFATDSSNISADFYSVLDSVALVINKFEKTYVDVIGHTDSTGAADYNQQLSVARASSVARYLESQQVLPQRVLNPGSWRNFTYCFQRYTGRTFLEPTRGNSFNAPDLNQSSVYLPQKAVLDRLFQFLTFNCHTVLQSGQRTAPAPWPASVSTSASSARLPLSRDQASG